MQDSKRIAALVVPVLIALMLTENPYVNPGLDDAQTPPVVYLNGTLLFVAGLAVIRAHNRRALGWPIVIMDETPMLRRDCRDDAGTMSGRCRGQVVVYTGPIVDHG